MDPRVLVTFLVVCAIIMYLVQTMPRQEAEPPPTKRRRRQAAAKPAAKPPASQAAGWSNVLKCVKWQTISNMLHWKSEMSNIDNLKEQLAPPQTGPMEHSA